jgi:hypothetical protein
MVNGSLSLSCDSPDHTLRRHLPRSHAVWLLQVKHGMERGYIAFSLRVRGDLAMAGYAERGERQMPRGPRGERRPADVIGAAIMVARLATGEISEVTGPKSGRTRSGIAGARARAKRLSPRERSRIAKKAASARWE